MGYSTLNDLILICIGSWVVGLTYQNLMDRIDSPCLALRIFGTVLSGTAILSTILVLTYFGMVWLLVAIVFGVTIYLIPEYIKDYKEGKARRERKRQHVMRHTIHHFVTRDPDQ